MSQEPESKQDERDESAQDTAGHALGATSVLRDPTAPKAEPGPSDDDLTS